MNLLEIVQNACIELKISVPTFVVSSKDLNVKRVLRFLNKEGALQVAGKHLWRSLVREATFTSVATEDQGSINTIAAGYQYMLPETMNDRGLAHLLRGSISPKEWQRRKAVPISGGFYDFRVIRDNLYITPTPPAGETIAFEYVTSSWVLAENGTTYKSSFTSDTDTSLLDADLLILAAIWRYKEFNGLEWGAAYIEYETRANLLIARDVPPQTLDFGERGMPFNINVNSVSGTVGDALTDGGGTILIA